MGGEAEGLIREHKGGADVDRVAAGVPACRGLFEIRQWRSIQTWRAGTPGREEGERTPRI
jgi:hypothetical protein